MSQEIVLIIKIYEIKLGKWTKKFGNIPLKIHIDPTNQ